MGIAACCMLLHVCKDAAQFGREGIKGGVQCRYIVYAYMLNSAEWIVSLILDFSRHSNVTFSAALNLAKKK